jgi:hypothetical protein
MSATQAWARTFYKFWGYSKASKIRKEKDYKGVISLEDAISYATEFNLPSIVRVVFPFVNSALAGKKKHDCLVVFPQVIRLKLPFKKSYSIHEIDKPILYNEKLYSLNEFLSKATRANPDFEPGVFNSFELSFNYFLMTTDELRRFKERYLGRVSKIIVDAHDLEGRGKKELNAIEKERRSFIIKQYKLMGKPKRFPIAEIQKRLNEYIASKYGFNSEHGAKLRCTDMTIYRTLRDYVKGRI